MLTLSSALKAGRLADFIKQEEKRGIGPVSQSELDEAIRLLATQPRSEDQTSRSTSRGGSRGK
jgi:hypothetical protein